LTLNSHKLILLRSGRSCSTGRINDLISNEQKGAEEMGGLTSGRRFKINWEKKP